MRVTRICTLEDQTLSTIDYYENVDGQPLIMIVVVPRKELNKKDPEILLPSKLNVYREITDEDQYQTRTMARNEYLMNEEDKVNTALAP